MAKGPLGNNRLTPVGPFTYDPNKPPKLPSGFEPPSDVTNSTGEYRWWKEWEDKPATEYGMTGIYDIDNDRVVIGNRMGPGGVDFTHDDLVTDYINRSPFPRYPDVSVPAEAGGIIVGDQFKASVEIPTGAGGAWVTLERLEDKELIEKGQPMDTEILYKYVYALALIDFPEDAVVRTSHSLGRRMGDIFTADRTFMLKEAYRELMFESMMPEPKVSPE